MVGRENIGVMSMIHGIHDTFVHTICLFIQRNVIKPMFIGFDIETKSNTME